MKSVSDCTRGQTRPGCALLFRRVRTLLATCLIMLAPIATAIQPVTPDQNAQPKLTRAFLAPELNVQPELEATVGLNAGVSPHAGVSAFVQRNGGQWEMRWDRRADRPNLVQGSGIALIPGRGNQLDMASLGLAASDSIDLAVVETRLRDFIEANSDLLKTDGLDFRLDPQGSIPYGDGHSHWFIELAQMKNDVPVRGANLFFRISHGNIVQFGSHLVAPVEIDTQPVSTRANAFDLAVQELGFPAGTTIETIVEPGELQLLPVTPAGEEAQPNYFGATGAGYAHRLAWRFVFRVNDDVTTYQILFDAHSNRVIEVSNLTVNADATVTGGIYPTTNTDPEIVVPMPFAAVSNNGAKVTDALGIYDYSGGTATVALNGKYFQMSDGCGAISLANSSNGNLNLGTSGGTDCVTPGVGGAGNTHASRSGFYHLTNINRKAVNFFPGNSWLASKVTANMNINDQCNAGWDGSTLNFFKSGGGCSNTGEIAAVFLHEWGHGMDTNSGGAANEYGSGEAVGDTFAFLETKDACIGKNFIPGQPCHNCDASCTGVRDVEAFSTHGAAVIAKPSLITDNGGPNCDRWACPYLQQGIFPYQGPMGYEGHCESYIASSANWDLTQSLIAEFGATQGWQEADRIWYGSLVPSKSAYRVVSGGKCNINATVDGCGSNNWYTVFLAADDDNGNLADGTPNGCRIWDAFDAHDIACGVRPACTTGGVPDFSLTIPTPAQTTCAPGNASYTINIGDQNGFTNPVMLSASGLPAGVSAAFSSNPVTPVGSSTLTLTADATAPAGPHTITVNGSASGSAGHSAPLQLTISAGIPGAPALTLPADGATGTARQPVFSWSADPSATGYTIQIASDVAFANIVDSGTPTGATYTPSAPLATLTTYYWRVRANSSCGDSAFSTVRSFTTGQTFPEPYCSVSFPDDVEPITRVLFDGIDNPSSNTVNGSPALEDFTSIIGTVASGQTLPMRVEGNTAGNFSTTITTFIDWNQDGDFSDAGETYPIGTIVNSTGTDGKNATANVAVPAGASNGNTRMRVTKKFNGAATACNTTGYGQAEDYTLTVGSGTSSYTVGGSVGGLAGSGLMLSLNSGAQSLPVAANGSFTFPAPLASGTNYTVTVATQPSAPAQTCIVTGGDGAIGSSNVTNVAVNCTTNSYTVGGSVGGMAGSGLVLSLNGGAQSLPVAANGSFMFPAPLASGANYAVTVATQPSAPAQTCIVTSGDGAIGSSNVTNVAVSCTTNPPLTWSVGGHVDGLIGSGLTLSLNSGAQVLAIAADGDFTFLVALDDGSSYSVTVATQPTGPQQVCSVSAGSGTLDGADVDDVLVTCSDTIFADGFEG